ncbi:MAG: suppressor of fused domain protein [Actinomycetota bacterium]|nr:suppressor of fused domain protein [Actinomycetota bacterium]MDQ2956826.1 suppressor of fused domain protein [Actinomycetota bacterium]
MTTQSPNLLRLVEDSYRQHFEVPPVRASVSFVGVEPIEILRFDERAEQDPFGIAHYLSLGMSRYPMTDSTDLVVDEAGAPRAELLITARGRPDDLWRQLAVLAAAPAVEGAVYSAGNRADLGQPLVAGSRCTGGVLATGPMRPVTAPGISEVHILRLLPATATELAWARVHGSEQLIERWTTWKVDLNDLLRDPVSLD